MSFSFPRWEMISATPDLTGIVTPLPPNWEFAGRGPVENLFEFFIMGCPGWGGGESWPSAIDDIQDLGKTQPPSRYPRSAGGQTHHRAYEIVGADGRQQFLLHAIHAAGTDLLQMHRSFQRAQIG